MTHPSLEVSWDVGVGFYTILGMRKDRVIHTRPPTSVFMMSEVRDHIHQQLKEDA